MLRAGVAQVDITPPVGIPLSGYILREQPSTGVHDPLYAKALLLDNGTTQVALLTCDLLGLRPEYVAAVRAAVTAEIGLPGHGLMIACTHTHAGPATLFLQGCGTVDEGWLERLRPRLVAAVRAAHDNLQPARLFRGAGALTAGVHNRRQPGDVTDPALGVLRVEDERGSPLGVLLNFACHPTCLGPDNRLISADYPGYALEMVARETGAVVLFATGAIGDMGPSTKHSLAAAEALGTALAAEALRVLADSSYAFDGLSLRSAAKTVALPLMEPLSTAALQQFAADYGQQLAAAEAAADAGRARVCRAMLDWAAATQAALQPGHVARTVPAEVQVLAIGDLLLVGVPGELFVELGLAIKQAAAPRQTFICGFANQNLGYIPARRAYPRGGYEVRDAYKYYGYPAALDPAAGEQVVETAAALIQH